MLHDFPLGGIVSTLKASHGIASVIQRTPLLRKGVECR